MLRRLTLAQVSAARSTRAVARPTLCTLHRVMMPFVIKWMDVSFMSMLCIVLPPHCAKYPRLSSHHFPIVPLTACTSPVHYSSLCLSTPRCSAATSHRFQKHRIALELQLLDMWFLSHRGGKGLRHSWAPSPFYLVLHWISTRPRSSISALPSTLY